MIGGQIVGDEQEAGRRGAPGFRRGRLWFQAGKVFLVRAHCGRQHLGRQFHALVVDRADQHDRELDETGHLVEQRGVRLDGHHRLRRETVEIAGDDVASAIVIEDHIVRVQPFEVIGGVVDADLALRQKTMPARHPADRGLVECERQDGAVEQADRRHQRPHPAQ